MTPEDYAIDLLRRLRVALQGYADNHLSKDPPQPAKAKTNIDFVGEINLALLLLANESVRVPDTLDLPLEPPSR